MVEAAKKNGLIKQLQGEILSMQGLRNAGESSRIRLGLGELEQAFPDNKFPLAAVHELLSYSPEEAAATNAFITGILSKLIHENGYCIWIAIRRAIYPPALKGFGINPDRILFIDIAKTTDALWVIEEALKCDKLIAVIGEIPDLNFTQSRRLQLAVENSKVTGFIHRCYPRSENTVACVSRWRIKPIPCITEEGMPGVGFPRWEVTLSKIRNGKPGKWFIEWTGNGFRHVKDETIQSSFIKTGMYG